MRKDVATLFIRAHGDAFSGNLVATIGRFTGRPFRNAVIHANRSAAVPTETIGSVPAMRRFEDVLRHFA